jgi:voltage-gated potassium channel
MPVPKPRQHKTKHRFKLGVPQQGLKLHIAFRLLALEIFIGTAGFMILEGYDLVEAFYMVIITISTVGFTEVEPLHPQGRIFTSLLILFNIGIFAYLLAVISYYLVEGEGFKKWYLRRMKKTIDALQDHVILCGFGKYGKEISLNLSHHDLPFVILEKAPDKIEKIQSNDPPLLWLEGDATRDELLIEAGIQRAKAIICALADDSDNLFIVLSARQLAPKINIISRAMDPRSEKKLMMAGANHVVMPEQIGGFYMATLVSKPGAVEFFSFITREYQSDIRFEEIRFEDLPASCRHVAMSDLHLRARTGVNVIGHRDKNGNYHVNPAPDTILAPDESFIVLGSEEQLEKLHRMLEDEQKG